MNIILYFNYHYYLVISNTIYLLYCSYCDYVRRRNNTLLRGVT